MLRLKILACKVLYREISYLSALSAHYTDTTYIKQKLHNVPEKLNNFIREEIARIDSDEDMRTNYSVNDNNFDAILLAYGLCSNCIENLSSAKYRAKYGDKAEKIVARSEDWREGYRHLKFIQRTTSG